MFTLLVLVLLSVASAVKYKCELQGGSEKKKLSVDVSSFGSWFYIVEKKECTGNYSDCEKLPEKSLLTESNTKDNFDLVVMQRIFSKTDVFFKPKRSHLSYKVKDSNMVVAVPCSKVNDQ